MATKINLTIPDDSPTVFANFAFAQGTATEVIIRFCLIDPARGHSVRKAENSIELAEVDAPTVVSVFLPAPIAEGLVKALTTQIAQMKKKAQGKGPTSA
jgi:hypothetical protein